MNSLMYYLACFMVLELLLSAAVGCWVIFHFVLGWLTRARQQSSMPMAKVVNFRVPYNHLHVLGITKMKPYAPPAKDELGDFLASYEDYFEGRTRGLPVYGTPTRKSRDPK